MGAEFYADYNLEDDYRDPNIVPVAVFLADGDKLRITSKDKEIIAYWGDYVRMSDDWLEHAKTENPLSDLFGRMTYINGYAKEYNDKTALEYERLIASVGGKTEDFAPSTTLQYAILSFKGVPTDVYVEEEGGVRLYRRGSTQEDLAVELEFLRKRDVTTVRDAIAGGASYYHHEYGDYEGFDRMRVDAIIASFGVG